MLTNQGRDTRDPNDGGKPSVVIRTADQKITVRCAEADDRLPPKIGDAEPGEAIYLHERCSIRAAVIGADRQPQKAPSAALLTRPLASPELRCERLPRGTRNRRCAPRAAPTSPPGTATRSIETFASAAADGLRPERCATARRVARGAARRHARRTSRRASRSDRPRGCATYRPPGAQRPRS